MKKYGILFDYNGVLVDDEYLQEKAMVQVLSRYECELTPQLYEAKCLGRSDKEAFERLQEIFVQIKDVQIRQLIQQKVEEYQQLIINRAITYPDIKNILQELDNEFLLAVVTGSLKVEVEPILEKEGIRNFFQAVITADDILRSKPNPEGYLMGINALGLPTENIIVIEDTVSGVSAAKAAGLKCIAVLHTLSADKLADADRVIKSIREITPELVREVISR